PKGVMIQHAALCNYLRWAQACYLEDTQLKGNFGLFTALSFDLTMTSLFLPLISGNTLQVLPPADNIVDTLEHYLKQGITMMKLTPAHVDVLRESTLEAPGLQLAILGGEALLPRHVEILRRINPDIRIYNEYGPTEATVGCTVYEVPAEAEAILIGRPIHNTQIYILDDRQQLVPQGVLGEICIGGAGLAAGYLNRPDLSQERFIEHPELPGTRIYRTGDLGRWLPDGNLDYRGRNDNQVKLRGYRIELDEIEQALSALEGVDMAVLLLQTDPAGEKELAAYYSGAKTLESTALREALQAQLPSYMIPNHFFFLEALPLSANGKVDKRALAALESAPKTETVPFVAPRNEKERALVEVWEEVLKRDGIGIYDNFFDLGGDSIKCILIASRLKRRGYLVKIADLMKTPILADLALIVAAGNVKSVQDSVSGPAPLTPVQKALLTADSLPNKGHYNQSILLESTGRLDADLLQKSLEQLVRHHDALRLVFQQSPDGSWQQDYRSSTEPDYQFEQYDLADSENWKAELRTYSTAL
ncbi:MAG: AMP-binding protein, partial [Phaeodactylibacter sp.]|nr:AMP-binding protein [Phaeodactylibacter sp.]